MTFLNICNKFIMPACPKTDPLRGASYSSSQPPRQKLVAIRDGKFGRNRTIYHLPYNLEDYDDHETFFAVVNFVDWDESTKHSDGRHFDDVTYVGRKRLKPRVWQD